MGTQEQNLPVDRHGVIREKTLFDNLYPVRGSNRAKSVSNPSAQASRQCRIPDRQAEGIELLLNRLDRLKSIDVKAYYVAELQLNSGARVSEVLNIRSKDITKIGMVLIRGAKGSNDRMVSCQNAREYLLRCRRNNVDPFQDLDRYYLYRLYKKVGISASMSGSDRKAVTHSFRYLLAKSADQSGIDLDTIRKQLGHKSQKSTKHYVDNKGK